MTVSAAGWLAVLWVNAMVGWVEPAAPLAPPWGSKGHEIAASIAVDRLPAAVPAFFRDAGPQLIWLDPEPDRWRSRGMAAMDQAWRYDHYVDFENLPVGALDAPDRFTYLSELYAADLGNPARDGGFLPYRITELYQRLVTSWQQWHRTDNGAEERSWIEARILNDAGILGHYVTDGSQPHHTTIHHNGWNDSAANPEGFTTDRSFHGRFESDFVNAHVTREVVDRRVGPLSTAGESDVRYAVLNYLAATHDTLERLYELERDVGFDPRAPAQPDAEAFAADRIAAGSRMLALLWWSAWLEGGA